MENQTKKTTTTNAFLQARTASLNNFSDIEHRLEVVAEIAGVEWINDSKSTDLDSTYYSLELMKKPIVWIVGASELDEDYSVFEKLARFKVKTIVCFGPMETRIKYTLGSLVENYGHKTNLDEAVEWASNIASKGDAVLLSPACSSFEQYNDFKQRGEHFRELVNWLKKR